MRITVRMLTLLAVLAAAAGATGSPVSAHEEREVGGGQYVVEVGFLEEPAFVGEQNSLFLYVVKPLAEGTATPAAAGAEEDSATPVEGLEATVQAEVIYGDQRLALTISPLAGEPGTYVSYFFPMAEGDYSFRISGTIEGVAVDETFTSGPETFNGIQPRLEFPATTASGTSGSAALPAVPAALALAGLAVSGVVSTRRRSGV